MILSGIYVPQIYGQLWVGTGNPLGGNGMTWMIDYSVSFDSMYLGMI